MRHGWKAMAGVVGMWVLAGCGAEVPTEATDTTQASESARESSMDADLPEVPTEQAMTTVLLASHCHERSPYEKPA